MSKRVEEVGIDEAVRSLVRDEIARHPPVVGPAVFLAERYSATADALQADIRRVVASMPCEEKAAAFKLNGWTYVLQVGVGASMCFKIGRSTDLAARLRGLQMATPYRLALVRLFHGDFYENVLHAEFSRERLHGEWFHGPAITEWALRDTSGYQCDACSRLEYP